MLFIIYPYAILSIIPVVLIEGFFLKFKLKIKATNALWTSTIMNLITTLIGLPLTWCVMFLILFVVGSVYSPSQHQAPEFVDTMMNIIFGSVMLTSQVKIWESYAAVLVLLIPSFFLSVYVERWVAVRLIKNVDEEILKKAIFKVNLISYILLAMFVIIKYLVAVM